MTRPLTQADLAAAHQWGRDVVPFYRNIKVAPGFAMDAATKRCLLEDCLSVHHGDFRDLDVSEPDKTRLCEVALFEAQAHLND